MAHDSEMTLADAKHLLRELQFPWHFEEHQQRLISKTIEQIVPEIVRHSTLSQDLGSVKFKVRLAIERILAVQVVLGEREWQGIEELLRTQHSMWLHARVNYRSSDDDLVKTECNMSSLDNAAMKYREHKWMHHQHVHWCIADALIHAEWSSYYRAVRKRFPEFFFRLDPYCWRFLGYFLILSAFSRLQPHYLFYIAIALVVARKAHQWWSVRRKLRALEDAYAMFSEPVISPTFAMAALDRASAKGIIWPPGLMVIIRSALEHNWAEWHTTLLDDQRLSVTCRLL